VWGAFPVVYLRSSSGCCPPGSPSPTTPPPGPKKKPGGCTSGCGWNTPDWKPQPANDDKPCDPCDHPSLSPIQRECCHTGKGKPTRSEVDLITGEYRFAVEDLPIQVLGWRVPFLRAYKRGEWHIELQAGGLQFVHTGGELTAISYDGTLFSAADEDGTVFEAGDGLTIFQVDEAGAAWQLRGANSSEYYFDATGRLLRIENNRGHFIYVDYDAQNRPTALRDTFSEVFAELVYTPDGKVASISAADGRTVQYGWTNGRLTSVTDPAGRVTQYTYDTKGLITKKRLPNGFEDNLQYSASGMVTAQLDAEGSGFYFDYGFNQTTQQFYSAVTSTDGRLEERWFSQAGTLLETLVDGAQVGRLSDGAEVEVDSSGNVTGTVAEDGTPLDSKQYDSQGRIKSETDARGFVTSYTYGANGELATEVVRDGKNGPVVAQTSYAYDEHRRVVSATLHALGQGDDVVTLYSYDAAGNIVHEVTSDGTEVLRTFDARGLMLSETDAAGNLLEWDYDAVGRLEERRYTNGADGAVAVEHWDYLVDTNAAGAVVGHRTVYTDPEGRQTIERFDTRDRPVEVIDPWGRSTKTTYDSLGDLVKLVTAEGEVTEFERQTLPTGHRRTVRKVNGVVVTVEDRDAYDRVVRQEADGEEVTFVYDGNYPQPAEEIREGVRLLYEYDYLGNRTKVRHVLDDGTSYEEHFTFKGLRQIGRTTPLGHTFAEEFNNADQLSTSTYPSGRTVSVGRDGLGRPVSYPSSSGDSALTLTYGDAFNVAQRTLPNGQSQTYTYDAAGQVTGIQTSFGLRIEVDLDRLGNPVEKRWYSGQSTTPAEVATFEYDSVGQRTVSQNSTVRVETERDYFTRATTTTFDFGPFSKSFTVLRDSLGRTTGLLMPDGSAYGYTYDGRGRLDEVVMPQGGPIDLSYPDPRTVQRQYPNGVLWTDERNAAFGPKSVTAITSTGAVLQDWQYALDAVRITSVDTELGLFTYTYDADGQVTGATYPTLSPDGFAYDVDGNRTSSLQTGTAPWTYSAADELLTIGSQQSFSWAPSGDLATRTKAGQTTTYEYDEAGRLSLVRNHAGQVVAEYGYDADGLRVVKKVGATTTYALYGEEGLLAEYDQSGAELRRYIWAPGEGWQRRLLAYEAAGNRYYPLLDVGGEVQKLTNAAGDVVWSAELRVFGSAQVLAGSTIEFNLRPSGQVFDAETGLHYNLFRYYDPELGRYISLDPLMEAGGNRNFYGFAFNNPVEFVDLTGLSSGYDGGDCQVNFKAGMAFNDASCSLKFKVHPLVSIKVKISIKPNKQDCCKDGKLIKNGKGCIEVKGTISGEVGLNPNSYPGIAALAKKAGIKLDIKVVTISASLGCNFCNECGESGYGANFDKCCAALEVEGPSFSFSWKAFKITLKTGKVTLGKVCVGPYGWSFSGPSGEGPSGGAGPKW
jgi:RHS repeat-associated protein